MKIAIALIITIGWFQKGLGLLFPRVNLVNRMHRGSMSMSTLSPVSPQKLVNSLPVHSKLVSGTLPNGFTFHILPNASPKGRFEAHLEVLSGSANELDRQQGMAHLLEHVAYMGSPKRQLISGTGSRTNAYTDFHHTVFFAACPTETPDQFWKKPMMPMALDALLDVMTTTIDDDRLEKERAAVLSEASMVNKMEYRVECQILSALHSENRISARFPIGKENLIKVWSKEDLQLYHNTHYRPDNVILFIVGDVDPDSTIETIKQKFGNLSPKIDSQKLLRDSGEFPEVSMRSVNRHFPPVTHRWSCQLPEINPLIPPNLIKPDTDAVTGSPKTGTGSTHSFGLPSKVFKHELLQSFSFHLFAKRPIEPITTVESLRRELMRRMTLSALQIRLNVQQRNEPLFTFVDFNQLNWPREGCAVCSLDLTTDIQNWRAAVILAVKEIRRIGLFGLTDSEVGRYKQAILTEAMQSAAQSSQVGNEDVLGELMEAEACGHTYMHPEDRLRLTEEALDSIDTTDVAQVARELCEHLSHIDVTADVKPVAMVACTPAVDRDGSAVAVSESDVADAVAEALAIELEPAIDSAVPDTLIPSDTLAEKLQSTSPVWSTLDGKAARDVNNKIGVVQKRLSNGIRVNLKSLDSEPQRAALRLYVPGGRLLEKKAGSVLVGSRTIQEGGAFLGVSREEVELFCIDHLVMVDIVATEEAVIFDFNSVTTPGPGGKVTGIEAVLQVVHIILTDFIFEEEAFQRSQQSFHEQFDSIVKGLESACVESLTFSLTGGDSRFLCPNHKQIDSLDLDTVKKAMVDQLSPNSIEISIAGDLSIPELEALSLSYLGTVPVRRDLGRDLSQAKAGSESVRVKTLGRSQQLGIYLPDSDERAMGYLAGPSPNRWGVYASGETISDLFKAKSGGKKDDRRDHPLFGHVALLILQEVANRRLFSVVREERQLTYDASFQLQSHDSIKGGWYLVSVTSSPSQVQDAIRACKESLTSLKGPFGVMGDSIQSAKRTILNRFRTESITNMFWVENMSGTQVESIPFKNIRSITEFESVLSAVTIQDIQMLVELFDFSEDNMTSCVGITSPAPPIGMTSK